MVGMVHGKTNKTEHGLVKKVVQAEEDGDAGAAGDPCVFRQTSKCVQDK